MTTKRQRQEMFDYLAEKLKGSDAVVTPRRKALVGGIESSYILIGDNGIVFLVDQPYPNEAFERIYRDTVANRHNFCPVFLKDGETFFRNAAERHYFKKSKELSLKHYNNNQMHRMILFRPEEMFAVGRSNTLSYYQPQSARLPQEVVRYEFGPVRFDYSHIDSSERFKPEDRESDRLHIWGQQTNLPGKLQLDGKILRQREKPKETLF